LKISKTDFRQSRSSRSADRYSRTAAGQQQGSRGSLAELAGEERRAAEFAQHQFFEFAKCGQFSYSIKGDFNRRPRGN
jgi:hypothetical protein